MQQHHNTRNTMYGKIPERVSAILQGPVPSSGGMQILNSWAYNAKAYHRHVKDMVEDAEAALKRAETGGCSDAVLQAEAAHYRLLKRAAAALEASNVATATVSLYAERYNAHEDTTGRGTLDFLRIIARLHEAKCEVHRLSTEFDAAKAACIQAKDAEDPLALKQAQAAIHPIYEALEKSYEALAGANAAFEEAKHWGL